MTERRKREVAWRVFSFELNSATIALSGSEAYDPNYVVTELGAKINRIFAAGVFTEKENMGSEDDPLWRARLIDPTGAFFISSGRFQPEATKIIGSLEPPQTLAISGKIRTFTSDDGRLFTSIRPETVKQIDIKKRNLWVFESCKMLITRLECLKEALEMESPDEKNLMSIGFDKLVVDGILSALKLYNYDEVDLSRYEEQAHEILVNLKDGLYDLEILPSEIVQGAGSDPEFSTGSDTGTGTVIEMEAKEDLVRNIVEELDQHDNIGAVYQKVLEAAENKGLTRDDTEECVNMLMNKGIIFEPALGYLKSIER